MRHEAPGIGLFDVADIHAGIGGESLAVAPPAELKLYPGQQLELEQHGREFIEAARDRRIEILSSTSNTQSEMPPLGAQGVLFAQGDNKNERPAIHTRVSGAIRDLLAEDQDALEIIEAMDKAFSHPEVTVEKFSKLLFTNSRAKQLQIHEISETPEFIVVSEVAEQIADAYIQQLLLLMNEVPETQAADRLARQIIMMTMYYAFKNCMALTHNNMLLPTKVAIDG